MDCRVKQLHIISAGNILVQTRAGTLRVSHLAQHTPVGAGNAFNGVHGVIGIEADVGDATISYDPTLELGAMAAPDDYSVERYY